MERQLEQQNDQEPNNQNDRQDRDERDNNRPPTNDHQEKDDQKESNVVSKQDEYDTNCPSELEVGALRMAQEMQMSALKGQVSTNLDELV